MLVAANSVKRIAHSVCVCEHLGMGNPLVPKDFDSLITSRLNDELEASSLSLRELSRRSEVKLTRLGDVLRRGKAMTVGELRSICPPLGLTASEVVREAEEAVARAEGSTVVDVSADERSDGMGRVVPLRPAEADDVPEPVWERMAAKMHPGRAREIAERTGWREDLGEESQVNPGWEE